VKQGKYDIALTLLETLEVLDSNDLYTLQTLGAIYIEMKKPEKALEFLLKALSLDPQNEMILFNKTQALISMGSKAEALEDCKLLTNAKNPHIKRKIDAYLLSQQIA
jgi:predicted Zn-dependent protease